MADSEVVAERRRRVIIPALNGKAVCVLRESEALAWEALIAEAAQHEQARVRDTDPRERERQRQRIYRRNRWAAMSPEEKRKRAEYQRNYWRKMPADQRQRYYRRQAERYRRSIRRAATLPPTEREAAANGSGQTAKQRKAVARAGPAVRAA